MRQRRRQALALGLGAITIALGVVVVLAGASSNIEHLPVLLVGAPLVCVLACACLLCWPSGASPD